LRLRLGPGQSLHAKRRDSARQNSRVLESGLDRKILLREAERAKAAETTPTQRGAGRIEQGFVARLDPVGGE